MFFVTDNFKTLGKDSFLKNFWCNSLGKVTLENLPLQKDCKIDVWSVRPSSFALTTGQRSRGRLFWYVCFSISLPRYVI